MMQIECDISEKLFDHLSKIKQIKERKEKIKLDYSDIIEEALLGYYNISLLDINYYNEKLNISFEKIKANNYIVFCLLDTSKKKNIDIDFCNLKFEPFYIGMGIQERTIDYKSGIRNNEILDKIELLKKNKSFEVKILLNNLTRNQAYNVVNKFIKKIGRKDKGNGSLLNRKEGFKFKVDETSELNLDKNLALNMIKALNNSKTKIDAAKLLNISERTLYRKMYLYNIFKDKKTKKYYFYE